MPIRESFCGRLQVLRRGRMPLSKTAMRRYRYLIAQVDKIDVAKDESLKTSTLLWSDLITHQIKFLQGEAKNDVVLVGRYKQWLGMLTKGYMEAQSLWNEIKRQKDKAAIIAALQASR